MMIAKTFVRFIQTGAPRLAVEKSNLAVLRKKTGYTFANCKKALELHNNDIAKAELWLKEQAKALGWSKATKLEGRQTLQGLVGVVANQGAAALVEVNCETDFVARNSTFQGLVGEAAAACLGVAEGRVGTNGFLTRIVLEADQLKTLKTSDSTALGDKLALIIGTVGENATLRRGFCFKTTQPSIHLYAYAHPSGNTLNNRVLLGRVAGVVALKRISCSNDVSLEEIGRGLCQHVVGMNPKRIGTVDDEPAKEKDDEECFIHQEFLEDQSVTVREVLEDCGVEIVDFKRFECGEVVNSGGEQPLEVLETCQ